MTDRPRYIRKPPPPERPEPLPDTAGRMSLACYGCVFNACCIQKSKHSGQGAAWCRILPRRPGVTWDDMERQYRRQRR
jgi:hypothetical protein